MITRFLLCSALLLASGALLGQETDQLPAEKPAQPDTPRDEQAPAEGARVRSTLGISILGNEETPTSLVIVPWKSSNLGDGVGVLNVLDDRAVPIDRDVFLRELRYYQIRSNSSE